MDHKKLKAISKFLSLVLRHQPEMIGLSLDKSGWANIKELLGGAAKHKRGRNISRALLETVVKTNDKQRFEISTDGNHIRARQGHSVSVELGYQPSAPPEILLHGTPSLSVQSIRESGLKKMQRHHVHLHIDEQTASAVGARRGQPVLLKIRAAEMTRQGHEFFVTENQVWLTDHVPAEFIEFPAE
jgi:putative RNA 2'-phosphotransferase